MTHGQLLRSGHRDAQQVTFVLPGGAQAVEQFCSVPFVNELVTVVVDRLVHSE